MKNAGNKQKLLEPLVVFVVLHYLALDDTIKCIESIKKFEVNKNYRIIIVDNHSCNGSLEELRKKYDKNNRITFIENSENLGFSKGNNVGFMYAKRHLKPDFIILCNNDVELLDEIIDKIYSKYKKLGFAVLGPREYLPDGSSYYINPRLMDTEQIKGNIEIYGFRKKHPIRAFLKERRNSDFSLPPEDYLESEHSGVVLHGAFLVFSKKYIDLFDGLDDRVFMYGEESLLAVRLKKHKLLSVYDPTIKILHNRNTATNILDKNIIKRIRRRATYELESAKILLDELEELEGKK